MRRRIRSHLAIGATAVLVVTGIVPVAAATQAAAAEPAERALSRTLLPEGLTIPVTSAQGTGTGSLTEAIDLIHASGEPGTIEIAPGVEITLELPIVLEQSVTIHGAPGGSQITWAPAQDDLGAMISGSDVTMQVFDVAFTLGTESMDPLIELDESSADSTLVFERVAFNNLQEGGVRVQSANGGVDLQHITAEGEPATADYSEGAVIEVWSLQRGLTMQHSQVSDTRMAALVIIGAELDDDEQILLTDNSFSDIDAQEVEHSGIVVSIDDVEADAHDDYAAVHIADNQLTRVQGTATAAVSASAIRGGLLFANNRIDNATIDGNIVNIEGIDGGLGDDKYSLMVTGNTMADNTAGESVLNLAYAGGSVLIADTQILRSAAGENAVIIDTVQQDLGEEGLSLLLDGFVLDTAAASEDNELMAGLHITHLDGRFEMVDSSIAHITASTAAMLINRHSSSLSISRSSFVDSTAIGVLADHVDLTAGKKVTIESSLFAQHAPADTEMGAGLSLQLQAGEPLGDYAVEIRDSSFIENQNGASSGIWLSTDFELDEEDVVTPELLVEGSTFWNPAGNAGTANDILFHSDGERDDIAGFTVQNSTFDGSGNPNLALPSVMAIAETAALSTSLAHVTMTGGAFAQSCDDLGIVRVHNSALNTIEHVANTQEACTVEGQHNTVVALGELPAAAGDIMPVSAWKLGALADNGGPTMTLLPAADSPLLDTAAPSAVLVDQRGIARPQGAQPDRGAVEVAPDTTVSFGPDVSVAGGSPATLTLTRQGPATAAVTAIVELSDGTAIDGRDYFADRFEVVWVAGETGDKTIQIETLRNSPGQRAFTAAITSVTGAVLGARDIATVTVTNAAVDPLKPVDPPKTPLSNTGSSGSPWGVLLLSGALLTLGALAFRARRSAHRPQ